MLENLLDGSIANATNTHIFNEPLKSEDVVAIFYICIQNLEEKWKKFSRCLKKQKAVKLKVKANKIP